MRQIWQAVVSTSMDEFRQFLVNSISTLSRHSAKWLKPARSRQTSVSESGFIWNSWFKSRITFGWDETHWQGFAPSSFIVLSGVNIVSSCLSCSQEKDNLPSCLLCHQIKYLYQSVPSNQKVTYIRLCNLFQRQIARTTETGEVRAVCCDGSHARQETLQGVTSG